MEKLKSLNRNLIYIIISGITLFLLLIVRPDNSVTAKGIFLPLSKQSYTPRPAEQVAIYNSAAPGTSQLGNIRVELHFAHQSDDGEAEVLATARDLAAQAGATGLIVNSFFGTPQPGLEQRYIFMGEAVV